MGPPGGRLEGMQDAQTFLNRGFLKALAGLTPKELGDWAGCYRAPVDLPVSNLEVAMSRVALVPTASTVPFSAAVASYAASRVLIVGLQRWSGGAARIRPEGARIQPGRKTNGFENRIRETRNKNAANHKVKGTLSLEPLMLWTLVRTESLAPGVTMRDGEIFKNGLEIGLAIQELGAKIQKIVFL